MRWLRMPASRSRHDLERVWHTDKISIDTRNALAHGMDSLARALVLGGAEGTRTPDPHTASVVRYQLRHGPRCPVAGHCAIVHSRPSAVTSDRRTASVPTKGSTQD